MGDAVNLASRLEGANKNYGTGIMVSEITRRLAGDSFLYRELDHVRVVGKKQAVRVYELVARAETTVPFPEGFLRGCEKIGEASAVPIASTWASVGENSLLRFFLSL